MAAILDFQVFKITRKQHLAIGIYKTVGIHCKVIGI